MRMVFFGLNQYILGFLGFKEAHMHLINFYHPLLVWIFFLRFIKQIKKRSNFSYPSGWLNLSKTQNKNKNFHRVTDFFLATISPKCFWATFTHKAKHEPCHFHWWRLTMTQFPLKSSIILDQYNTHPVYKRNHKNGHLNRKEARLWYNCSTVL